LRWLFGLGAASRARARVDPPRACRKAEREDAPKKGHSSTARRPAARLKQKPEGQKRETPPPARPATGPGVHPPDKRQPRTRKKGTPENEPVPESLPGQIKFGMLDGNAVRFTNLEAWWLVDGAWRSISPGEVLLNAAVLREARFNQLFPQVPRLPSDAFKSDNRQD